MSPTPEEMLQGISLGLPDLVCCLKTTDVGTPILCISSPQDPYPVVLAVIWWYGIEWEELTRGKRRCLKEGWCCEAVALEGYRGEHPTPTVDAAVSLIRELRFRKQLAL